MFEKVKNSKKQGDVGMGYAIAYFCKLGWTVSIPITDSQDYDLIVDNGEKLLKVQVKTSRCKCRGKYAVNLKICGGNRSGQNIKNFDKNLSDLLFVLIETGDIYLIPREKITQNTSITIGKDMEIYKVSI